MKTTFIVPMLLLVVSGPASAAVNGYFDAANFDKKGNLMLSGWACTVGIMRSTPVQVVAVDRENRRTVVRDNVLANAPSEPAVGNACGTKGVNHRFQIELTNEEAARWRMNLFYVQVRDRLNPSAFLEVGSKMNPYGISSGSLDYIGHNAHTGDITVHGWACLRGVASPKFNVLAVAGDLSAPIGSSGISVASEQAVNDICANGHSNNRFQLTIPAARLKVHNGKGLGVWIVEKPGELFQVVDKLGRFKVRPLE